MPHHRYAATPATRLIDAGLHATGKTVAEAARDVGVQPNLLSMIRTGACALPARRCADVARALGLDPMALMVACLRSYPDNRSWAIVGLTVGLRAA